MSIKLSYSWIILDQPIMRQEKLSNYLAKPKPSKQQLLMNNSHDFSPNTTIHPLTLSVPLIPLLFAYCFQQQQEQQLYDIQLDAQLQFISQGKPIKIQLKVLQLRKNDSNEQNIQTQSEITEITTQTSIMKQKKSKMQKEYIYLLMKIQNCECYEKILNLLIHIRYRQNKPQRIDSVQNLIKIIGARQTNLYARHTHALIRKQLVIQEPLLGEYKVVQPSDKRDNIGYVWMKLIHHLSTFKKQRKVIIKNIELLVWLNMISSNCDQQVKSSWSKQKLVKLSSNQIYAVMFWMPRPYGQVPYLIDYSLQGGGYTEQLNFRMIKYIKMQ